MNNTREKGRAVFLAALMVLSVIAMTSAFAGGATAQTTTVSGGGDALQIAIDNADQGDVIEVTDDSTYNQIIIDRSSDASDLMIRAADDASPTISHDATSGEPTVAVDQNSITLEGFTIERSTSDNVAQAVRVAGDNIDLIDNTYELDESTNDAAVGVLTDSSGAAGNPPFSGPINDVEISGGEIITNDASQTGVLVADNGDASFGSDGSVSVSGVTFTANADSTHVLELDTGGGVVDTAAALNENTFDTAASPDSTTGEVDPGSFARDGLITSTIQGAIDGAASGTTVDIVAGTYKEDSIEVDVQGLTLKGPNAGVAGNSDTRQGEAILDLSGTYGIEPIKDEVTIDGLTIRGSSTQLIGNNRASDISYEIKNNVFDDFAETAVRPQSPAQDVVVKNNLFDGDGKATQAFQTAATDVTATIKNNVFDGMIAGIGVAGSQTDSATLMISGNQFDSGLSTAIYGQAGADIDFTVEKNNFDENIVGVEKGGASGTIDATLNWWGDASGPSGGASDAVTAISADGTGAAVSGPVAFEPWLDAPVPNGDATFETESVVRTTGQVITPNLDLPSTGETQFQGIPAAAATVSRSPPGDSDTVTFFISNTRLDKRGLTPSDITNRGRVFQVPLFGFDEPETTEPPLTELEPQDVRAVNSGVRLSVTIDPIELRRASENIEEQPGTTLVVTGSPPDARLGVAITDTNAPVSAGDPLTVDVRAISVGGFAGTEALTLEAAGESNTTNVSVASGGRTSTTLSVPTDDTAPGEVTITVNGTTSTAQTTATITSQEATSTGELLTAIDAWRNGERSTDELLTTIAAWRASR